MKKKVESHQDDDSKTDPVGIKKESSDTAAELNHNQQTFRQMMSKLKVIERNLKLTIDKLERMALDDEIKDDSSEA